MCPYNEVIDVLVGLTDFESFMRLMGEKREEEEERRASEKHGKGRGAQLEGFGLQVTSLNQLKAGKSKGQGRG